MQQLRPILEVRPPPKYPQKWFQFYDLFSREITNRRYNMIVKSLTDVEGIFDIGKGQNLEMELLKQLKTRNVDNFWRIDKVIQTFLHRKIVKEIDMNRREIVYKRFVPLKK